MSISVTGEVTFARRLRAAKAAAARRPVPFAQFAAVWVVMATLRTTLFVITPGTAWQSAQLPLVARIGLACFGLVTVTVVSALLTLALSGGRSLARTPLPARRRLAPLVLACAFLVAWVTLLLYFGSWAAFRVTGQFLDLEAWSFLVASPLQVLQHAGQLDPLKLVTIPAATLAGTVALRRLLLWVEEHRAAWARRIVSGVGVVMATVVLTAFSIDWQMRHDTSAVLDSAQGTTYELRDLYELLQSEETGPIAHVLHDTWDRLFGSDATEDVGGISVVHRAVIPMPRYVAGAASHAARRFNVLVILVESLRNDQLRAFGGRRDVMPSVDAFARQARRYTNAFSSSSHTNYATVSALSSQYPLRARDSYYYPEHPTYPRVLVYDVLHALGYRTAIISSQNEHWAGMLNYLLTDGVDFLMHSETFRGPTYVPRNDEGFADWIKGNKRAGKIDDRFTIGEAIRWIDSPGAAGRQPFFAYVNLQSSHVPYERPADFPPRFGSGRVSFPIYFDNFPEDSAAAVRDVYANSLAYADAQLARLFDALDRRGLWDSTIVVITGDHGEAFYEHGFSGHGSQLYDEVLRIPLMVRAPGLAPGDDDRPASIIDIAPTVLSLLGRPEHPSFQGVDLVGVPPRPDRPIFAVTQTPIAHQYAVVRDGWKLIFDRDRKHYLLYDLTHDPAEKRDLSMREPAETHELAVRLSAWMRVQLGYYSDRRAQAQWYPPVLKD